MSLTSFGGFSASGAGTTNKKPRDAISGSRGFCFLRARRAADPARAGRRHLVLTTVNCIKELTGNPPADQSIDAWLPAGTVNRRYAVPPATIFRFAGAASDRGTTDSGSFPS